VRLKGKSGGLPPVSAQFVMIFKEFSRIPLTPPDKGGKMCTRWIEQSAVPTAAGSKKLKVRKGGRLGNAESIDVFSVLMPPPDVTMQTAFLLP
jgi:hypothetical protein